MIESNPNPFAAPSISEPSGDIRYKTPISVYMYAGIVFGLALCIGLGIGMSVASTLSAAANGLLATLLAVFPGFVIGAWGASRMFHRLDRIHREMFRWEVEQAERAGEFLA